jgi:hyperosmotically inducible periplasmic protein
MKNARFAMSSVMAIALIATSNLAITPHAFASPVGQEAGSSGNDSQIQAELTKSFNKSRFKDIRVEVHNGVVTLAGSVQNFSDKEEADKKAHRTKNVVAVRNEIEIAGSPVPDDVLQQKLVKALEYDRVGYGTTAFNAIAVSVHDGVVTLSGHAYGPTDKDSALSAVSHTPGVRDVIDEVEVDPVSPMDDRIRLQVARAVYGYPPLQKYAIDPGKPIRISVQNGNVTLYGVVDNKADSDAANIRANGVPGVFKVVNDLQVANEGTQRK